MDFLIKNVPLILVVLTILIYIFAFSKTMPPTPTCANYVVNTYLYLAASIMILILATTTKPIINSKFAPESILNNLLLIFIFSLILIVFISIKPDFLTSYQDVILSHISWILFILCVSYTFSLNNYTQNQYTFATVATSIIFLTMSVLVYLYPTYFQKIDATLSKGLFVALLSVIFIEILILLIPTFSQLHNSRFISYAVIAIFSLYVAHDTTRMFELSEKCRNMPNYPKASIGFFLDIINLFSRTSHVYR